MRGATGFMKLNIRETSKEADLIVSDFFFFKLSKIWVSEEGSNVSHYPGIFSAEKFGR